VLASDHAGYELKNLLAERLKKQGIEVYDAGTYSAESVDYPDYAEKACLKIVEGVADFGILVCGTGIGMSIAANKIRGIRAAVCTSTFEAVMARRHNNANVLCLGSRVIGDEHAYFVALSFLAEEFEGGRHQRRIDKINSLEEKS
jgi:ribose 5-phosphate isomerase B